VRTHEMSRRSFLRGRSGRKRLQASAAARATPSDGHPACDKSRSVIAAKIRIILTVRIRPMSVAASVLTLP
jgi:hypothetical protein